jgi:hypothetical protein
VTRTLVADSDTSETGIVDVRTATADRPWWALVLAAVALATFVWLVEPGPALGGPSDHRMSGEQVVPMLQVAPGGEVELAALPHDHQVLYEAAAADREAFTAVRCHCGCEAFLDHRHLLDCFERPDGGWERHATGCAVCLAEAEEVGEHRRSGLPLGDIVDRIDAKYGGITSPPDLPDPDIDVRKTT